MPDLIVTDRLSDWPARIEGVQIIAAADYLTAPEFARSRNLRVYNLCDSFRYQTTGYYVSLLATARGQKPFPDIATIQDLKSSSVPRLLSENLRALMETSLRRLQSEEFELSVYFGQSMAARHNRLAKALYNLFPVPLLRARFRLRAGQWQLDSLRALALADVSDAHAEFLEQAARNWFGKKRRQVSRKATRPFDLALLANPQERDPPSNAQALAHFEAAANAQGFDVTRVQRDDFGAIAEYDALFIRETTFVNHHTYRFARRAELEGLVVMDDPTSILRCTNKVFLTERLQRSGMPMSDTLIVHRGNRDEVSRSLGLPCVLKQPDSAFSRGVKKAETAAELKQALNQLLESSDLIIAQRFMPTDYDWRVGVLNGEALYVCRYFMAPDHWQIVQHSESGAKSEGDAETLAVADAPPALISLATKAALSMGQGLYGVDIKQLGKRFYVIEVNDNPNIDAGVEDAVLGMRLYERIMQEFRRRVEAGKHVRG